MSLKDLTKLVKNLTEEKSTEEKFLYELNETMSRTPNEHKPSKFYKPSSIGGCKRNIYYQRIGVELEPEKQDCNLVGICESGSNRHEDIQNWVTKMSKLGYKCEWVDVAEYLKAHPVDGTRVKEKRNMETKCFNDNLQMSFLCDGIIKFDGSYYILEIKTEVSYKFQGQVKPFEEHIEQATCYSLCLGIDNIMFLYEDRNFCSKKTFLIPITQDMKNVVVDTIFEIEANIEANTTPTKSVNPKDCNYCLYKNRCHIDG